MNADARMAVLRWRQAGASMQAIRRRELRELTELEGLAAAESLLDLVRLLPPKEGGSGLVEQQRLFALVRRS